MILVLGEIKFIINLAIKMVKIRELNVTVSKNTVRWRLKFFASDLVGTGVGAPVILKSVLVADVCT